jgi:hypothetical protein
MTLMTPREFIATHDVRNALARARAAYKGTIDHHWFEPTWDRHLQKIADVIEAGETDLFRIVDKFRVAPLADGHQEIRNVFKSVDERLWFGERMRMNPVLMGHLRRALVNAALFESCSDETESVVELGAGDGMNLCEFWLTASPRQARYMAFEIASTGRLCAELLGTLDPRIHLSAHAFDYYTPNYEPIPDRQKHMLVFTISSIEQIKELPKAVIEDLLDKADAVSGVHFEPIGWQLPDHENPRHKRGCLERGYNENLWPLLSELQQAGRISIDRVVADIYGKVFHPATLIQWHKVR